MKRYVVLAVKDSKVRLTLGGIEVIGPFTDRGEAVQVTKALLADGKDALLRFCYDDTDQVPIPATATKES